MCLWHQRAVIRPHARAVDGSNASATHRRSCRACGAEASVTAAASGLAGNNVSRAAVIATEGSATHPTAVSAHPMSFDVIMCDDAHT